MDATMQTDFPVQIPTGGGALIGEVCLTCGQVHELGKAHLYDYFHAVDQDLSCHICLQPLVDPVDTRCGHTYCCACVKTYVRLHGVCPLDDTALSDKDTQPASIMVQR